MTIEELWEEVSDLQEWSDTLREQPLAQGWRLVVESLGVTLATICILSRHYEDW